MTGSIKLALSAASSKLARPCRTSQPMTGFFLGEVWGIGIPCRQLKTGHPRPITPPPASIGPAGPLYSIEEPKQGTHDSEQNEGTKRRRVSPWHPQPPEGEGKGEQADGTAGTIPYGCGMLPRKPSATAMRMFAAITTGAASQSPHPCGEIALRGKGKPHHAPQSSIPGPFPFNCHGLNNTHFHVVGPTKFKPV